MGVDLRLAGGAPPHLDFLPYILVIVCFSIIESAGRIVSPPVDAGGVILVGLSEHGAEAVVVEGDAHVEDALRCAGGAAHLQRDEPRVVLRADRRRQEVADEDPRGPHQDVSEPRDRVDLDVQGRLRREELLDVDVEGELVVPRGVGVVLVGSGRELLVRVDPNHGVGPHGLVERGEILGRDEADLEDLGRERGPARGRGRWRALGGDGGGGGGGRFRVHLFARVRVHGR